MAPMGYLAVVVAALASCAVAEDSLLVACEVQDIECLRKSTEKFLSTTANGIPQYDLQPIDPMKVDAIDQDLGVEYGIKHALRDLTVTGLKNQVINDFKMDTVAKTVLLKVTAKINLAGKLTIQYSKPTEQSFTGTYSSSGDVLVSTTYPYEVQKAADGVDHFVVGKETIVCEATSVPQYSVNQELMSELDKHEELKAVRGKFHANAATLMKASMCDLIHKVYPTVVHNIRASAKVLPKTAYFKNL